MKTEPLVLKEKTEIQVLKDRKCRFVSTRQECKRTNCVSDRQSVHRKKSIVDGGITLILQQTMYGGFDVEKTRHRIKCV